MDGPFAGGQGIVSPLQPSFSSMPKRATGGPAPRAGGEWEGHPVDGPFAGSQGIVNPLQPSFSSMPKRATIRFSPASAKRTV